MDANIEKGKIGEKYVYDLAKSSFLSYWCYPNPLHENGDKKEICDLIIHFRNTIMLCCVKNYEFKGKYSRYFRKAIEKDVRQLYGAEKKIKNSPDGIKIKNIDGRNHIIHSKDIATIYRVIIHLGENVHFYPFNKVTQDESFVHVFDKTSFHNITQYLDTISDFEKYLSSREAFFKNKIVVILPSEEHEFNAETGIQFFEYMADLRSVATAQNSKTIMISGTESDLLAGYLENNRNFPQALMKEDYTDFLLQVDDDWKNFLAKTEVKNKLIADQVSYFIDEFINNEILNHVTDSNIEFAKELLSFDRFNRRIIANALLSLVRKYNNTPITTTDFFLARRYIVIDGISIILVFYPTNMIGDPIEKMLSIVLDTYAVHTNYKHKKTIIIAATKNFTQVKFGLEFLDKPFEKAYENQVKENIKLLNWFTNTSHEKASEEEFPSDNS